MLALGIKAEIFKSQLELMMVTADGSAIVRTQEVVPFVGDYLVTEYQLNLNDTETMTNPTADLQTEIEVIKDSILLNASRQLTVQLTEILEKIVGENCYNNQQFIQTYRFGSNQTRFIGKGA